MLDLLISDPSLPAIVITLVAQPVRDACPAGRSVLIQGRRTVDLSVNSDDQHW